MRIVIFALWLGCGLSSAFGQIARIEYFFDKDPGPGAGLSIPVEQVDNFVAPVGDLDEGPHLLYVRAQDALQRWSHTSKIIFFLSRAVATDIVKSEYFIDIDPGAGHGSAIGKPSQNGSQEFIVPLKDLATGHHLLYVRSVDNTGRWSTTQRYVFFNAEDPRSANIVKLEYYFKLDGKISSVRTFTVPTPGPIVSLDFEMDLKDLQGNAVHEVYIVAVDDHGNKSLPTSKKVKICDGAAAEANFQFVQAGNQVSFIDASKHATSYAWDFGDGKKFAAANPYHEFPGVGAYKVRLVASNVCNADTIQQIVNVEGLREVFSDRGGNKGIVSVDMLGAGFVAGMKVFLHSAGANVEGDTVIVGSNEKMTSIFSLDGQRTGLYDVVAAFPNGKRDTLYNAFTIEDTQKPTLTVSLTGSSVLRIGFEQIYTVTYSNSGNRDVYGIPLFIGGLPLGTEIEIIENRHKLSDFDEEDTLGLRELGFSLTQRDTISRTSFRRLLLRKIAAGSSGSLHVIFHVPQSTPLHTLPRIACVLGTPYSEYEEEEDGNAGGRMPQVSFRQAAHCLLETLRQSSIALLRKRFNSISQTSDVTGFLQCHDVEIIVPIVEVFIQQPEPPESGYGNFLDFTELELEYTMQTLGCIRHWLFLRGLELQMSDPEWALLMAWGNASLMFTSELLDATYVTAIDALKSIRICWPIISWHAKFIFSVIIGNAWDPNDKFGPGDESENHYMQIGPMNYTVNFQNDPAANLNAQTVTVTDTLDVRAFDVSTFGFTAATVGKHIYTLSSPAQSFVHDFDLVEQHGVKARVTGTFEPATGVILWKYFTIDPATNQVTTNVLDGFLPPDKVAPEGQGSVSFIVHPRKDAKTGDIVENKAIIKFDFNPVIITNTWRNVFDMVKPTSGVTGSEHVTDSTVTIKIESIDNLSGVDRYDVYYSINNRPFSPLAFNVTTNEVQFTAKMDSIYSFYSVAHDNAGNPENTKTVGEYTLHLTNNTVGNEPEAGAAVKVYPNPIAHEVTVVFDHADDQPVAVSFTDLVGHSVLGERFEGLQRGEQRVVLNTSGLVDGVYFCEVVCNGKRKMVKVVKR